MAYFAWVNDGEESADAALTKLRMIAETLQATPTEAGVVDKSAAIAGLTAASIAADDQTYIPTATTLFESIHDDFDADTGVFNSKQVYTTDDVAWIIGGSNFLAQQTDSDVQNEAFRVLLAFYESTISLAGLQLSAPPGKNGAMASPWEQNLPGVVYYHPVDTPPPPGAGKLTVPWEEITWDGSKWQLTSAWLVRQARCTWPTNSTGLVHIWGPYPSRMIAIDRLLTKTSIDLVERCDQFRSGNMTMSRRQQLQRLVVGGAISFREAVFYVFFPCGRLFVLSDPTR